MRLIYYGRVFALTVAFFAGASGCSDQLQQKEAKTAKVEPGAELTLAADELPDWSDKGQPEQAELDQEKPDGEVVEIPLDQIWAWRMPGTRSMDASVYRSGYIPPESPFLKEIRRSLHAVTDKGEEAGPGFAVHGTGMEALKQAHAVLVEKHQPRRTFQLAVKSPPFFFASLRIVHKSGPDSAARHGY